MGAIQEVYPRVLAALADADGPLSRRQVQQAAFGDKFGATSTAVALRWLDEHGLAETAYDVGTGRGYRRWQVTEAGRSALALADEMAVGT